jgi:hypothetical protein
VVHLGIDRLFPWKLGPLKPIVLPHLLFSSACPGLLPWIVSGVLPPDYVGVFSPCHLTKNSWVVGLLVRMRPAFGSSTRRSCCGPCICPTSISQLVKPIDCSRALGLVTSLVTSRYYWIGCLSEDTQPLNPVSLFSQNSCTPSITT